MMDYITFDSRDKSSTCGIHYSTWGRDKNVLGEPERMLSLEFLRMFAVRSTLWALMSG